MAKTIGEAGRYTAAEYNRRMDHFTQKIIIISIVNGLFFGITLTLIIIGKAILSIVSTAFAAIFLLLVFRAKTNFLKFVQEAFQYAKGTYGEKYIASILDDKLSNDYYVIHDLSTKMGNIDHVVVGPTGIFLIDTKNWKGIVTSGNNRELLLNGQPTSKNEIKQLIGRTMDIKKQIIALTKLHDAFFQPLMVFPMARVDAKWGTTSSVRCITDEQLIEHIMTQNENRVLKENKDIVKQYAEVFLLIARMDNGFEDKKQ